MVITLSRKEVEKILLDYANKLIEGHNFNDVAAGSYHNLPGTIELSCKEQEVQE
jgi:hypothetical protein